MPGGFHYSLAAHWALVAATLGFATGAATLALGAWRKRPELARLGRRAVGAALALVGVASALLLYALVSNDFSLQYVARRSARFMPLLYKVGAFWGGQEGSLLLWLAILAIYTTAVMRSQDPRARRLDEPALAVLAAVAAFFAYLVAFVASPFLRLPVPAAEGEGLNPLLQHPSMVTHPVALYAGFVGFSVPFAYFVAAMAVGDRSADWIRVTRRWALIAWTFLTAGILLGGEWAYQVLGWGGYWGWDPVENSSLLPWLVATAFLHSGLAQERRGLLKKWNALLIVATFALTIFGTLLTRSGILVSVHAFAESDIGPYFLSFLGVLIAGSMALILNRLELLEETSRIERMASREAGFLANNVVLVAVAFAVFFGTIIPLITRLWGVEVTVGAPYFERVTAPMFLVLLVLMGLGPLTRWRGEERPWVALWRRLAGPAVATLLFVALVFAVGAVSRPGLLVAFGAAFLTLASAAAELARAAASRRRAAPPPGLGLLQALVEVVRRNPHRYGGYLVHVAVALLAIGVAGSQAYTVELTRSAVLNQPISIGDYTLLYRGLGTRPAGAGATDVVATLEVYKEGRQVGLLQPSRRYHAGVAGQRQGPTTQVALHRTVAEDLYAVLAGWEDSGAVAGFELYVMPLVNWVWVGGFLMVLGAWLILGAAGGQAATAPVRSDQVAAGEASPQQLHL